MNDTLTCEQHSDLLDSSIQSTLGHHFLGSVSVSNRALNSLTAAGIRTIRDLIQNTEADLLRLKSMGRGTIEAIKEVLASNGLALGTSVYRANTATAKDNLQAITRDSKILRDELNIITMIINLLVPMPINQRDRVMRTVHCWLSPGTIQNVVVRQ